MSFVIPPDLDPEVMNAVELARGLFPSIIAKQLTGGNLTTLERETYAAVGSRNKEELLKIASRYKAGER